MGVVRLYHNDAIRAGFLGVDHQQVETFVRNDLQTRKQKKQETGQITVSDITFHLPVPGTKFGEVQISLQGSASFALSSAPGEPPRLTQATLSNVQGAAQGAWAKDLFKDLLQVQLFVQAVGGANFSQTPTPGSGTMRFKAERMAQDVLGTQLAFTASGTGKHVQIFVQGQVSKTDAPSGGTNDEQFSFGVSYAP